MQEQGFGLWNRRDFQQFINGSAKFGRTNYDGIATEVDSKTPEEIAVYARAFWKRYTEITDYDKHIKAIEAGEERMRTNERNRKLIRKKREMYRVPLQQLKINYTVSTTNKKVYTEEEDRFLLVMMDKHGVDGEGLYERIRDEIRGSPIFRFDWFFLSRTPIELSRRCATLLNTVVKEFGEPPHMNGNGKRKDEVDEEDEETENVPPKKKQKPGVVS